MLFFYIVSVEIGAKESSQIQKVFQSSESKWELVSNEGGSDYVFVNENVGWRANNTNGLYKTNDSGTNWTFKKIIDNTEDKTCYIKLVDFASSNIGYCAGGFDWYSRPYDPYYISNVGFIRKTINGGESWELTASYPWEHVSGGSIPINELFVYDYNSVWFFDWGWLGTHIYAHVIWTKDGGASWDSDVVMQANPYPGDLNEYIDKLYFISETTGWIITEGYKIYKTVDSGHDWVLQQTYENENINDLVFYDQNVGWAVGDNGFLVRTVNGGNDWDVIETPSSASFYATTTIGDEGWIVGDNGTILKSSDKGNTWSYSPTNINDNLRGVFFLDSDHGWAWNSYKLYRYDAELGPLVPPNLIDPVPSKIGVGISAWFQWSSIGNATSYDIQIDSDWDFSSPLVDETYVNDTRYFVEDMQYSHTYHWRVRSRDGSDVSDWSESRQFTTMEPTIPEELSGCLWVKTAYKDNDNTTLDYITLTNTCPSVVYVGYDWRATQVPAWLSNNFTDTGLQVAVYDDTYFLNIWEKAYGAGDVVLGGNMASPAAGALSNYVVFLKIDPTLSISGAINYFQSSNPVPSVEIQLIPDSVIQNSGADGLYRLENLQAGIDYIVTPQNEAETLNSSSAITSQDAYETAQIAMGNSTPSSYQSIIADVDGDGRILMWDASLIARYSAGIQLDDSIKVGDWQFDPEHRSYPDLQQSFENQDYIAYVIGDVDASWPSEQLAKGENPNLLPCSQAGDKITVQLPLYSQNDVNSFDFSVNYDADHFTFIHLAPALENFQVIENLGNNYLHVAAFRTGSVSIPLTSLAIEFDIKNYNTRPSDIVIDRFIINGKSQNLFIAHVDETSLTQTTTQFRLFQNYPNPFNPQTTIRFDLPWANAEQTSLKIYDVRGTLVRTLCDGILTSGTYNYSWNGRDINEMAVPSGVYICQLKSNLLNKSIKIIKTK